MKKSIIILITLLSLLSNLFSFPSDITKKITEEDVIDIFNSGKEYFIQKKYKQALEEWSPLIENNIEDNELKKMLSKTYNIAYHSRCNYYRGLSCFNKKQLFKAREYFIAVNNINPYYKDTVNILYKTEKNILVNKYSDKISGYIIRKEYNYAVDTCMKLLLIDPDNQYVRDLKEQALLLSGITSFSNKEYIPAREVFCV